MVQASLTEDQKKELGKKIVDIISSLVTPGSWCEAAKIGMAFNESGISYLTYGFEKLKPFLNEFSDYLDFRNAPSPKEGAPAIFEIRVKTDTDYNDLKLPSMKSNVFLPDEAILARIARSQQQRQVVVRNEDSSSPKIGFGCSNEQPKPNCYQQNKTVNNGARRSVTSKSAADFLFGKKASATEKFKAFAFFPKDESINKANGFFDAITKLSKIALEETWGFGDDNGHNCSILVSFFTHTFERLVYEDETNRDNPKWKPKIRLSRNGKLALFNTGLVDEYFEPVYALFGKVDPFINSDITSKWVFKYFPNSKNNSMGLVYQNFGNDEDLPKPANYLERNSNSELIYNLDYKISQSNNWDHIIAENCIRLPRELFEMCGLRFDFSQFDNPLIGKETLKEKLAEALGSSNECCRRIKHFIERAIVVAEKRVHWNFKTAIPIYYPKTHKICLLLPLCLCDEKKVDAALVLDPIKDQDYPNKGMYIQRTILTLEMAYIDARLITRPDSDWLAPRSIAESTEGDSDEE